MDKIKELLLFVVCIAAILGCAYHFGFIKGFGISDISEGIESLASSFSVSTNVLHNDSGNKNLAKFGGYIPQNIPQRLVGRTFQTPSWNRIFNANQTVVFYIYNEKSDDFDYKIRKFLNSNPKFLNASMTEIGLRHASWGYSAHEKVCNSLKECNEQRENAVANSTALTLLEHCGKTMCIINPQKKQYIMLKKRDATDAVRLINDAKRW